MKYKVGDKVRMLRDDWFTYNGKPIFVKGQIFTITKITKYSIDFDETYSDGSSKCITVNEADTFLELVLPTETTVAREDIKETNEVLRLLEDAAWYDKAAEDLDKPRAKSRDTIALLVKILVSKGVISSKDVSRILKK